MVKRLLGKAYKSTIMQRKQRMFEANIEDTPGFKQYLTPQHLQPPRSSDQKAVARQADVPYERVSSYKALRDLTAGRTPSDELNSTPKHKPLAFIDSLLNPPPSVTADGPGALTEELALQMVTHPTHTDAQRGSSPHNLRLSFMGRRVLEMHLQMFLLHAAQQEGKKVGEKGDASRTALLDTQRKVSVEEEDADPNPEAAVTEAETDSQEALAADASAVDPIAEAQEGEEPKPSWEHPSVPSFADASPSVLAGHAYGRPNMWRVVRPDGEEIGDGTPGSLAEELVRESALGYLVGRSWNVDSGMRYGTKIAPSLNVLRGSVVQSIFGGASHAYGVGFTSRLFHSRALPLMKDQLPAWTWTYVDEQRLKVLAEGGLWGPEGKKAE